MALRTLVAALVPCLIAACDGAPGHITRTAGHPHTATVVDHTPAPDGPQPVVTDPDPTTPEPTTPEPDPDPPTPDPDPTPLPEPAPEPTVEPTITTFPFVDRNDSLSGRAEIHNYGCAPGIDESGPELVYRVAVPEPGLLVASLDDLGADVDVDVHILRTDGTTCLDRGHWDAAVDVEAGEYLVIVDSWVDAAHVAHAGAYTVTIGFTGITSLEPDGLDGDVLDGALHAFAHAWQAGETDRLEYTIIDFSLHSLHPRLWTIDLRTGTPLFVQRVSHGEGSAGASDLGWATTFSNVDGSHMSSLGLMRTATRYQSADNGLSLRLDGLEQGINDAVRSRAIVIHSDSYASASFVAAHGRMGLSWGCQVVDPSVIGELVDTIEGGSLVWSWYPDAHLRAASTYLDGWTERE